MRPLEKLVLQRDRRAIVGWVLGAVGLTAYAAAAYNFMFSEPAERAQATALYATPVVKLFTGPGYGLDAPTPEIGAMFATEVVLYLALIAALAGSLMTIARTRGDEDNGPGELLRAAAVTPLNIASASLQSAALAGVLIGGGATVSCLLSGLGGADAALLGVALALTTLCGAGLGLLVGALAPSARTSRTAAMLIVLLWYLLRSVGDVSDGVTDFSLSWLSWLSPLGLVQQIRLWADIRLLPLGILAAITVVLIAVGLRLHARRELRTGLLPPLSDGRSRAAGPRGVLPLELRVSRNMRLGWLFVGFLFGITYGIFAPVVETAFADLFNDNPTLEQFVGGTLNVELYLQMIMQYGGFLAAASAVTFALGAVGEEERGVTAGLLSAPVARLRWLASRITVLVIGSGALLLALGLGLLGSAIPLLLAGDYLDADAARHLATSTALGVVTQWPATLLLGALVVAVHGLVPRGAKPLGWGLFVLVLFLTLFAPVLNPPQWVLNLSPFTHVPALPTTSGNSIWGDAAAWAGPGICLFLAAILMIVGLWGMRRRDLMA